MLPGLGLPQYTFPLVMAVAALGLRCTVLDLPGFGSGTPDTTRASIHAIGYAAAQWVLAQPEGSVTVLVGHSTGAQAALTTASRSRMCDRPCLGPGRSDLRPPAAPAHAPGRRHPHGIPA